MKNDIYVISVLFCYAFMHVCLLMPCGHLLGKGWPLGSRLWCLIVTLSLSHWYPGSGVVLDCIDSWYFPSFLLWLTFKSPTLPVTDQAGSGLLSCRLWNMTFSWRCSNWPVFLHSCLGVILISLCGLSPLHLHWLLTVGSQYWRQYNITRVSSFIHSRSSNYLSKMPTTTNY